MRVKIGRREMGGKPIICPECGLNMKRTVEVNVEVPIDEVEEAKRDIDSWMLKNISEYCYTYSRERIDCECGAKSYG